MATKNAPATQNKDLPKLSEAELKSLKEVYISINWRGIKKAWNKMFYEAPFNAYQGLARKVEGVSRKMMTGYTSAVGMPVGIVLRNSARAAHNSSEGSYGYVARIIGGIVAAGVVVGVTHFIGAPLLVGALGKIGGYAAAFIPTALIATVPSFTAGTLAASTLISGATAVVSTVLAAPLNLLVGLRRSRAAAKGYKLSEEQLEAMQEEFDRESPTIRRQREAESRVNYNVGEMSDSAREKLYLQLKDEFEPAAKKTDSATDNQAVAAPAAKRSGGLHISD